MSAKQFLKSNAFKCLATLFCILLICGVFLTIAYGFLEVSDEERFQRAISKIYGKTVTTEEIDISEKNTALSTSTVSNLYLVTDDGNYLVKVAGKNGFGGSVTCWVVVETNDDGTEVCGVGGVSIDSAPGESYISYISDDNLAQFSKDYVDGIVYEYGFKNEGTKVQGDMYIGTGASYSYRAISNAVNGAIEFVKAYLSGEEIVDPYADYLFHDYINMESTTWTVDNGVVTYTVVTQSNAPANPFTIEISVGTDGIIQSYTIKAYGSTEEKYDNLVYTQYTGKDAAYFKGILGDDGTNNTNANYGAAGIPTGATRSNYLCLYAGLFATANYEKCLEGGNQS